MEGNSEESQLQRKKAAAQQRLEEHIAWKRSFFQARPPPPPIGRLHRRQKGITKGHSCHDAFHTAMTLTKVEGEENSPVPPTPPPLATSLAEDADSALTRQEMWAAQLHREKEQRNPSTDLNVRSDPYRTVIVANLHPDTVEEDLRHFADQFGRVVSVRIVRHHKTGKSRRYAFVEFGLAGEARKATQFNRKKRLKGHAIIIDREKGRTEPSFLPKRMAAASSFWASTDDEKSVAGGALGEGGSSASGGEPVKAARPTLPQDNDEEFLESILNS